MKVTIPSGGDPNRLRTPALFSGDYFEPHVVVHTADDRDRLHQHCPDQLDGCQVHVSGAQNGAVGQRHWIQKNLVQRGEWYVMADDNIERMTAVPKPQSETRSLPVQDDPQLRDLYDTTCTMKRLREIVDEMVYLGNSLGAYFQGPATVDNYFFRGMHYRQVGFVWTKFCIIKATHLRFNQDYPVKHDYEFTAQHLREYGRVLVNNYLHPDAAMFEEGGIGSYDEREEQMVQCSRQLMAQYPGLFRFAERPNRHPEAEVRLRFNSPQQVENWRADH